MTGASRMKVDDDPSLHVKFARLDERLHLMGNVLQGMQGAQEKITNLLGQIQREMAQVAMDGSSAIGSVAKEFQTAQAHQADQFTAALKERDEAMERALNALGDKFFQKPNLYKWIEWIVRAVALAAIGYILTRLLHIPISINPI